LRRTLIVVVVVVSGVEVEPPPGPNHCHSTSALYLRHAGGSVSWARASCMCLGWTGDWRGPGPHSAHWRGTWNAGRGAAV